ncbi:MAG: tripartite tricarboxylate transporter TctB family protein [Pararhodobacter sp.]|nr:tripartite tricarboxylate transporter TctB family protein [Pararhodobacter sp.]
MQDNPEPSAQAAGAMGARWLEATLLAGFLVLIVAFVWASFAEVSAFARSGHGRGPYFFPRLVLGVMALLLPFLVLRLVRSTRTLPERAPMIRLGAVIALTALYIAGLERIGFVASSIVYALAIPLLLGRRDLWLLVPVAVVYALVVWLLFERAFLIILPAGSWWS